MNALESTILTTTSAYLEHSDQQKENLHYVHQFSFHKKYFLMDQVEFSSTGECILLPFEDSFPKAQIRLSELTQNLDEVLNCCLSITLCHIEIW